MLKALGTKKFWIELLIMTIGMAGGALAVHCFLTPTKLIIGSISGVAIVIENLTNGYISVAWGFGILNVILLTLALILIGPEFGIKTIYTTIAMFAWLWVFEKTIGKIETPFMGGDMWWNLLCFILILSVGQTILFRINASTGGLDIIAKIINKFFHIELGTAVSISGAVLCTSALFLGENWSQGVTFFVYGLIGTVINGLALNFFSTSLNRKKRVCIISRDYELIKKFMLEEIGIGATLYDVEGAFSGDKTKEVVALLPHKEDLLSLMSFIEKENIKALVTVSNADEVYGLWNRSKEDELRTIK